MDKQLRDTAQKLRGMSSRDATDWLLHNYPVSSDNYGIAFTLLAHLSLTRLDQVRLARHYFSRIPFANDYPYSVFAKMMSLTALISVLVDFIPEDERDINLFKYYLLPVLAGAARSDREKRVVEAFRAKL